MPVGEDQGYSFRPVGERGKLLLQSFHLGRHGRTQLAELLEVLQLGLLLVHSRDECGRLAGRRRACRRQGRLSHVARVGPGREGGHDGVAMWNVVAVMMDAQRQEWNAFGGKEQLRWTVDRGVEGGMAAVMPRL